MEEKLMKMEELACNLTVAVAERYDISARDAVSIVMQSSIAGRFLSPDEQLLSTPIDALASSM